VPAIPSAAGASNICPAGLRLYARREHGLVTSVRWASLIEASLLSVRRLVWACQARAEESWFLKMNDVEANLRQGRGRVLAR
jgi:hypothetical protein